MEPFTLIISLASSLKDIFFDASIKAFIAPKGFFLSIYESKSKIVVKIKPSPILNLSETPNEPSLWSLTGCGITFGSKLHYLIIASAMKFDGTHKSLRNLPLSRRGDGNLSNSHAQKPILYVSCALIETNGKQFGV